MLLGAWRGTDCAYLRAYHCKEREQLTCQALSGESRFPAGCGVVLEKKSCYLRELLLLAAVEPVQKVSLDIGAVELGVVWDDCISELTVVHVIAQSYCILCHAAAIVAR